MQFLNGNAKKSESLYIFVSGMNKLSDITKKPVVINFTNRFNSFAIIY